MERFTLLIALSAGVLLAGASAVAAPFDITTADGNGADTYVSPSDAPTAHGDVNNMIAWEYVDPHFHKIYMRFDLSAIAQPLSSAKLTCTTIDGQFAAGTTVWGLNDGDAGELWDESIIWVDAPANDTASGAGFLSNATYLGEFGNITNASGGTGDFSADALKDFLNADTDGVATFMCGSPNGFTYLATKENGVMAGPTLTVEEIPEPTTLSLIGLGVLGLLRRRRA